jgi:MAP/microtubule affinity-regulating kinase
MKLKLSTCYPGVYEVPPDIGRGAERVLKGCLDRSVQNRWTIAMVDEVAWGIGWGSEGDDVTPAESDEEFEAHHTNKPVHSPSRSRSRHPERSIQETQWQHDERRSRPSIEVASRRSSSRMQRSISRAPLMTRSSSGKNILGRSMSRHSRAPSPSFSALNNSILSSTRPGNLSRSTSYQDSALVTSPPLSLERGRRLRKVHGHSPSPSSSPSAVPTTPTDSRSSAPMGLVEAQPDDFERESSRGRRKYGRGLRALNSDHLYSAGGDTGSELDVVDETADWTAPTTIPKRSSSAVGPSFSRLSDSRSHHHTGTFTGWNKFDRSPSKPAVNRVEAYFDKKRAGSSPPAPISFWSLATGNSLGRFAIPRRIQKFSSDNLLNISKPAPALNGITRSRSLEYERGDASYLRRRG